MKTTIIEDLVKWVCELEAKGVTYILTSDIFEWGRSRTPKTTSAVRKARELASYGYFLKRLRPAEKRVWERSNFKTNQGIYKLI